MCATRPLCLHDVGFCPDARALVSLNLWFPHEGQEFLGPSCRQIFVGNTHTFGGSFQSVTTHGQPSGTGKYLVGATLNYYERGACFTILQATGLRFPILCVRTLSARLFLCVARAIILGEGPHTIRGSVDICVRAQSYSRLNRIVQRGDPPYLLVLLIGAKGEQSRSAHRRKIRVGLHQTE